MSGHSLTPTSEAPDNVPAVVSEERCLNCDAPLTGEYCANCGQHRAHHVHSTPAMIGELIEDLFHADNRVWRTVVPLLLRPGKLTVEYLRGKRVTYTPPFRLYIVLSLIFFLTTSLSTLHVKEMNLKVAPSDDVVSKITQTDPATNRKIYELDPKAMEDLEEFLDGIDKDIREEARTRLTNSLRFVPTKEQKTVVANMSDPCSATALGTVIGENKRSDLLFDACRKVTKNNGQDMMHALRERVPQMLFFFLPLIALFAKVLYLGSHRYYAEHVLFFVHYHAFVFLLLALNNTFGWLIGWIPHTGFITGLMTAGVWIYAPIYLQRAMRTVYRQGGFVTGIKFLFLIFGYLGNMVLTFGIFAAVAAMTLE